MTPEVQPAARASVSPMPDKMMVFEQTIEGLFNRALGDRVTKKCKERLRAVGLDLDKTLLPAYEFESWMTFLRVAAEEVFPECELDDAMYRLGERMVDGFQDTFIGRAVLGMVRLIGPARTLQRTDRNFRSGNNYTQSTLKQLGPTSYELWMNEVGPYPSFTAGIIAAGLRAAGAKKLTLDILGYDGHGCTYRVTWE